MGCASIYFYPIPYKAFTISAGVVVMPLIPFVLASLVGRGARFFLAAALMRSGGAPMEAMLRKYIDLIGWIGIVMAIFAYLLLSK